MSQYTADRGQRAADRLTEISGSWGTIGYFTIVIGAYLLWNSITGIPHFDPYPFEFLTFSVSIIANYQAMIVMVSQRGQLVRDRKQQEIQQQTLQTILTQSMASREMLAVLRDHIIMLKGE